MKVRYLGQDMVALCRGKIYDVIGVENGWYRIMTEIGEDYLFPPESFVAVKESGNEAELLRGVVDGLLAHACGVMRHDDPREDPTLHKGRCLACREMLDIVTAELQANGIPPEDYGLGADSEKMLNPRHKT